VSPKEFGRRHAKNAQEEAGLLPLVIGVAINIDVLSEVEHFFLFEGLCSTGHLSETPILLSWLRTIFND
jgi:hypothetical protein